MQTVKEFQAVQALVDRCNELFPEQRLTTADHTQRMQEILDFTPAQVERELARRSPREVSNDPPIGQAGDCYIKAVLSRDDDDLKGPSR
jgi:hypothetical protein